eukprot:GHUV01009108.1.p1 GENE.GHUV01009108.1~~GHUV01009108.1.p1  ORF type:complete len:111 (+),score=41.36 GHUV01009108.1:152-484(+)
MVEQTGTSSNRYLREVAQEASFTRAQARSSASATAQALHLQRMRAQGSVVIGQQYVSQPVGAGGAAAAGIEEYPEYAGVPAGEHVRSDLGMSKYTAQVRNIMHTDLVDSG